jgi:hypothetical protein
LIIKTDIIKWRATVRDDTIFQKLKLYLLCYRIL